jgi:RND family efflux transporter MFP subunit
MTSIDKSPSAERAQPGSPPSATAARARWPGPSRSRRGLSGLLVLALFVGVLALGVDRHERRHVAVMQTARHEADFVPNVRVEAVRQRDGSLQITLPGTTLAFDEARIYARASGYVLKRFVDIGDHVKAGQVLAEITAPEVDAQVSQYQNSLAQAVATVHQNEATRSLAQITSTRFGTLANDGWVSHQVGDTDQYGYQAQSRATDAAKYNASSVQSQLRYYAQEQQYQQVTAPFDGVVTERNINVGSLITADATGGTAMFSMVDSNVIRIWVYVPQDDAFGVKPGVNAVISVPNMPSLRLKGKVTRIADALQPGTRTLLTEVDVSNPEGSLSPGLYCNVELEIPRSAPALIVPASAIIFNQRGMQVAVVENGVARLRPIAIAKDLGDAVEVSEGVKGGDEVVLQPSVNLADGDKVAILPDRQRATP